MPTEESYPPRTRMEEEESARPRHRLGFRPPRPGDEDDDQPPDMQSDVLGRLLEERQTILSDSGLPTRDKLRLLENNRLTMVVAQGGTVRKTENVVTGILIFATGVTIILALLNVTAGLRTDVTMGFLGTTLGGTIATIAQKLGRL